LVTGQAVNVTLLGNRDELHWVRTTDGLVIDLPATLPCKMALCFKVSGLTTIADARAETMKAFEDRLRTR
jgi:hypothetical protein